MLTKQTLKKYAERARKAVERASPDLTFEAVDVSEGMAWDGTDSLFVNIEMDRWPEDRRAFTLQKLKAMREFEIWLIERGDRRFAFFKYGTLEDKRLQSGVSA